MGPASLINIIGDTNKLNHDKWIKRGSPEQALAHNQAGPRSFISAGLMCGYAVWSANISRLAGSNENSWGLPSKVVEGNGAGVMVAEVAVLLIE